MTTTISNISGEAAVRELAEMQVAMGLPDGDFSRAVKLEYSGSSWGKIKAGTFSGNAEKALRAVRAALAKQRLGGVVETEGETVIFDHIRAAVDAVQIARVAVDEHKLIVVSGSWGAGKSTTAAVVAKRFGGHVMHARPSWATSYLRALCGLAGGIGLGTDFRSMGKAESEVLGALQVSPALLIIDEANHFSRDALNFLKTILNETRCAVMLLTLPGHLARIAAQHSEETRQLLRRAVAIIHIGPISSADVMAVGSALYPEVTLGTYAPAITSCANRHARMDTVRRIFEETDASDPGDLPAAIARVEGSIKTILG